MNLQNMDLLGLSPRHFLLAHHVAEPQVIAFLDTNNLVHWRRNAEAVQVEGDASLGILDADLPAGVGFLPIVPTNVANYFPTNSASVVQGIGMNARLQVFSQGMTFGNPPSVIWNSGSKIPFGVGTNWGLTVQIGDSSAPERLLVGNQLVLLTFNSGADRGPNCGLLVDVLNQSMHYLSTNNPAGSDYQLTIFPLTNWPTLR